MRCVLCRALGWLGTQIFTDNRIFRLDVVRTTLQSWRYAQTNDTETYQNDPELNAIWNAEQLTKDNPPAALSHWRALAERGSVWSMFRAGWAFQTGTGVAADQAQAERWYRLSFEGGCQQAQLRLGSIYTRRREFEQCEKIYEVGAREDWAPALYYLAWAKLRQPKTPERLVAARNLLEQAAALGDLGAEMDLVVLMSRGRFGLRLIPRGFRGLFDAAAKLETFFNENAAISDAT